MNLKVISEMATITAVAIAQTLIFFVAIYPEFYLNGDNEFYNRVSSVISDLPILLAYASFAVEGGSGREPLSFLVFYIFSKYTSYYSYFIISNFIFQFLLGLSLRRLFRLWFVPFILVSFSFYVFIASGLTQRLAIAIMFLMVFVLLQNNKKNINAAVAIIMSIMSHFQILIIFIAYQFAKFVNKIFHLKVVKIQLMLLIFFPFVAYFLFGEIYEKIDHKIGFHADSILILLWPTLLTAVGHKLKLSELIIFMVIFIIAIFITSGRLNILCFFYSLYVLQGNDKSVIYFCLILTPYFIYKHINYFSNFYLPNSILS